MAGIEIKPYKRLYEKYSKKKAKKPIKYINLNHAFMFIITFLLSRAVIGDNISPFAAAFFSAAFSKVYMMPMLFGGVTGAFSAGLGVLGLKYALSMLFFAAFKLALKKQIKLKYLDSLICGACIFAGGLVFISFKVVIIYDVLLLVLESFGCAMLFQIFKEATLLLQSKKIKISTNEQLVSLGILAGLSLLGLKNITTFGPVSLCGIICIVLTLMVCHAKGATVGACIGIACGFIYRAGSPYFLETLGLFGVCALVGGLMHNFERVGTATGFSVTALIISAYANIISLDIIGVIDLSVAVILFLAIPKGAFRAAGKFMGNSDAVYEPKAYSERFRDLVIRKLKDAGRIFSGISETFSRLSESRIKAYNCDIAVLFDDTAERVCKSCSMANSCWESDFNSTYQTMFDILDKMEKKGYADVLDVPEYFRERCIRIDDFVVTLNHLYEMYKLNEVWVLETSRAQKAVSEQYTGMAGIMAAIADEIDTNIEFNRRLEKRIAAKMAKLHIRPLGVAVPETESGRVEVEIAFKNEKDFDQEGEILLAVSEVLGQPMKKTYSSKEELVIRFEPVYAYSVTEGVACLKKTGELRCGDSHLSVNLSGSRHLIAISDGMGSGEMAAVESGVTISLLEQLMMAGFDRQTTVSLINSALVMKSGYESFATIDLCFINLANAVAEFVKIGGVQSYIKTKEGVSIIYSSSLPAGILCDVHSQVRAKKLEDKDVIVMISDGVFESSQDSGWIAKYLATVSTDDPKALANQIIKEAVRNSKGEVRDDMTVVVAKIWAVD